MGSGVSLSRVQLRKEPEVLLGRVEACNRVWRGVVLADIVSHPSRQQSDKGKRAAAMGAATSSRTRVVCDDASASGEGPGPAVAQESVVEW